MSLLTKKLIEAGIIRKHAARMLERWGTLPAESVELAHDDDSEQTISTEEGLIAFAQEIDEILSESEKGKAEVCLDNV